MKALADALRDPASTARLDAEGWTALIAAARAEQLIGSLAFRVEGQPMPGAATRILADARASAEQWRRSALWEAEMARRALIALDVPVILMKGTAYAATGLDAGVGRSIGDLDIMVPRETLGTVEAALLAAGWEWVKPDPYDDAYYREHMHELPPLIHRERDRMIDVHHTILPLTARVTPDAAAMVVDSVPIEISAPVCVERSRDTSEGPDQRPSTSPQSGEVYPERLPWQAVEGLGTNGVGEGLRVFSPEDMVLHGIAHLFADGDLAGGLRNLWDQDRLLRQLGVEPGFWDRLGTRAQLHGLTPHLALALRLTRRLYATPVDPALAGRTGLLDAWFVRRLLARDGWGRSTRKFTQLVFYIRSHWLRMPPFMLARHLWTKWRKG
jgi:hypothetical protein